MLGSNSILCSLQRGRHGSDKVATQLTRSKPAGAAPLSAMMLGFLGDVVMSDLFVQHKVHNYVGIVIGKTRITHLFENQNDIEECRVQLPSGKIRIASEANLRHIDRTEYNRLLGSLPLETMMGGRPRRFGGYWERVRNTLSTFWSPPQELWCTAIFTRENSTCQMCGHFPIKWNHVLQNLQSGRELIVGSECIKNYRVLTDHQVIFPKRYRRAANYLNGRWPDCVAIVASPLSAYQDYDYETTPRADRDYDDTDLYYDLGLDIYEPNYGELAAEGLDPDEIDWDSENFERD